MSLTRNVARLVGGSKTSLVLFALKLVPVNTALRVMLGRMLSKFPNKASTEGWDNALAASTYTCKRRQGARRVFEVHFWRCKR